MPLPRARRGRLLLRQAAQRLRLAAIGVALFFAGAIVVVNLIEVSGLHTPSRVALQNVIAASMIGLSAWVAWLAIHIFFLIGFRNRVLVLFQWAYSYVTFRRGARLITGGPPPRVT